MIHLPDTDKMAHLAGGALVGALAASVAVVALDWYGIPLWLAAVPAVAAAYATGRWKEWADADENAIADMLGRPRPHSVETGDWQYTAWGGVIPALLLLALQVVEVMR